MMDIGLYRDQLLARGRKVTRAQKKRKGPKFGFGKYRNKSVQWVLENDPDYIIWCWRNVAKCYVPFGEDVYRLALGHHIHKQYDPDDIPGDEDMPEEMWARELADE